MPIALCFFSLYGASQLVEAMAWRCLSVFHCLKYKAPPDYFHLQSLPMSWSQSQHSSTRFNEIMHQRAFWYHYGALILLFLDSSNSQKKGELCIFSKARMLEIVLPADCWELDHPDEERKRETKESDSPRYLNWITQKKRLHAHDCKRHLVQTTDCSCRKWLEISNCGSALNNLMMAVTHHEKKLTWTNPFQSGHHKLKRSTCNSDSQLLQLLKSLIDDQLRRSDILQ